MARVRGDQTAAYAMTARNDASMRSMHRGERIQEAPARSASAGSWTWRSGLYGLRHSSSEDVPTLSAVSIAGGRGDLPEALLAGAGVVG
jgi:hypothetical protein